MEGGVLRRVFYRSGNQGGQRLLVDKQNTISGVMGTKEPGGFPGSSIPRLRVHFSVFGHLWGLNQITDTEASSKELVPQLPLLSLRFLFSLARLKSL